MSGYTRNAVYTRIRGAVLAVSPTAYVTSKYEPQPAKFPAVFARQIGESRPIKYATLNNNDDQWRDTFEVQIFSAKKNGEAAEAYLLMDAVKSAFRTLGYRLDMCEPVDNADTSIYRLVARWHRTTGAADQMPDN